MKHSGGRYLFVMETSKEMRSRSTAAQKAVSNLLLSGMQAQLQRGDTIGVWTYNEQLHAGQLPLQQWTPERERIIASNIVEFLQSQPFAKKSRFDAVWPALQPLVKESEWLTVLLVSDGENPVSGTPYDREINEFFKRNSWKQKQKRMPFVTVLRSYRGRFAGVTMNLAPWPVEFPPFPPEAKVAAKSKPKSLPPKKVEPHPTAPPLIVIGDKPEPVGVPESTTTPSESATTTPLVTVEPKPDVSPVTATPATPNVETKPPVVEQTKPVPAPVVAKPETEATSPPVAAPAVKDLPTESSQASTPPATAPDLKPDPATPPATEEEPQASSSEQVATAVQPKTVFSGTKLVLICLGLLVLAVVIFLVAQRRARTTNASLITQSMDQNKK